jgi:hypothetical protein
MRNRTPRMLSCAAAAVALSLVAVAGTADASSGIDRTPPAGKVASAGQHAGAAVKERPRRISIPNTAHIQKRWVEALSGDLDDLVRTFSARGPGALIANGSMVWHSTDGKWMTAEKSLDPFRGLQGPSPFTGPFTTTATATGFICQTSLVGPTGTTHIIQVVTVTRGQVSKTMEYIAPQSL